MKRVGIVRFPASNCDQDVFDAVNNSGYESVWLWHKDKFTDQKFEAVILPGGFSYGDYLRCGALAAKSPVMSSVIDYARKGGRVLGICNGFQILTETRLLDGALLKNQSRRFVDRFVTLKKASDCQWAGKAQKTVKLPVAHGDGCFFIDQNGLKKLQDENRIWWQYEDNPNGSAANIAGIFNKEKNVAALMPHPERAYFDWMGSNDGKPFFLLD